MKYLNISTLGLRGRHQALSNMITTNDVKLSRPHVKFLAGNYLTYQIRSEQSGGSPRCRICPTECPETVSHVISTCSGMAVERERLLTEFSDLCTKTKNEIIFQEISKDEETLCQFILDTLSLNLQTRVDIHDPLVPEFYRLSRVYCYIIDKTRLRLLKDLENNSQ